MQSIFHKVKLHNGVEMPWLGLGVFQASEGGEIENTIKEAAKVGYRSIDTASMYKNEVGVGIGIRESGISRDEFFVTTKVWNEDHGYERTLQAFEQSRQRLALDVIDLYLIHWPGTKGKYKETWRALEELYERGEVRAIGVSNFNIPHLEDLLKDAKVKPMVNQVEYHPYLTQKELLNYCTGQGIVLEAWSPLARGGVLLDNPVLQEIGKKHGKTPAQVILRWDIQNGVVTIPKSVTPTRIRENAQIFDFQLSTGDMNRIDCLNTNQRLGPDPDIFG